MGHVRNDVTRGLGRHEVPGQACSRDLCLCNMFTSSPGSDFYMVAAVVNEIDGYVLVTHALESVVAVMAVQDNHGPLVHNDGVLDHAIPHQITLDPHQVLVQNLLVLPQGVYGYQRYCHSFSFPVSSPVAKKASHFQESGRDTRSCRRSSLKSTESLRVSCSGSPQSPGAAPEQHTRHNATSIRAGLQADPTGRACREQEPRQSSCLAVPCSEQRALR